MKYFNLIIIFILSANVSFAQKISGAVSNENGQKLPFSTVLIKGTSKGTASNNEGYYTLPLESSKSYLIVCSQVGYATQEKLIKISGDTIVNFELKQLPILLDNVVISNKGENPAYRVIRQAIRTRAQHNQEGRDFQCEYYAKDLIRLRKIPNQIFGQPISKDTADRNKLDSTLKGIIYLSESVSDVFVKYPEKFKLLVKSSRLSGSNSFGFTFPVFINLYDNNVDVFDKGFNSRGFISPISDGALNYYKYKMLGTFEEGGRTINRIRVIPKRKFEPLFIGEINIVEGDWHIHSFDLQLTKESQLEVIDSLKITQLHVPIEGGATWKVKNQILYFNVNVLGFDAVGNFLSVYSDYQLNPVLKKGMFDNIMIKYDSAVNQFPTAYWDSIRPVPLNAEEINDYKVKDSMFNLAEQRKKMPVYMDSLRKQQGKIKWLSLPFSGLKRTHYGKHESYRWGIEPLLMNTNYNTVEGVNTELKMSFEKYFSKSRMKLNVNPLIRYGFYNGHLNPSIQIGLKTRNRHKSINTGYHTWGLKFGREVVQFNELNPIQPLLNTWTTLFDGNNPMKIYERSLLSVTYKKHAEQGWDLTGGVTWEDRNPLSNNTSFTIKKQDSIRLTPNVPRGRILPEDIYKHQLFALSLGFSFQPGQKFIQFPKDKVSMGSDYPVFSVNFKKAIPGVLGADADFEKWDLIVTDEFSLRMLGAINYKVETGGFTRRKKLLFQDYKHFNANTVGGLGLSVNGFKLMDNYINSNDAQFYAEAHIDHHFKGLLTNKIPGLRKWKWDLVTGVNTYWINSKDYYYEFSVGIENILKIFRLDYVFSYQNGSFQRSAFVLGAGGLLGNGLGNNAQSKSSSVSIGF